MAIAAYQDRQSATHRLSRKRFACLLDLFERVIEAQRASEEARPVRILDVGGSQPFWRSLGLGDRDDCHITLLNLFDHQTNNERFTSSVGDGRDLARYPSGEFDMVFSNSGIERVGGVAEQMEFAREVRRVGRHYFVRTPSYYFPLEPHFQFPCFQFLPLNLRRRLVRNFALGNYRRAKSEAEASEWVNEIRLLARRELAAMFPEAQIVAERVWGLARWYTAIHSPNVAEPAPRG